SFSIDEQGLKALGLKLIAGRAFRPDEIGAPQGNAAGLPPQLVITRHLAEELFPGATTVVGRNVYAGGSTPSRIVGVVDRMFSAELSSTWVNDVTLEPRRPDVTSSQSYYYLVRTEPGQRDRIMRIAEEHLSTSDPDRVIDWVQPLAHFERVSYAFDTLIAGFMSFLTCILICIAALGIFGLATFNVTTRVKQIGTRRAIGARRSDIIAYFLVENAFITTAGVVLGCALALGVGYFLSIEMRLPRLDLYYLIGGVVVLFLVGQLAALHPARRAASVPPSVATRTV
ncbi:MAG: ABC transporter permease, partial [Steroidobacteraceae bacterium]